MLKRRLIPVLFLRDGWMVRSEGFNVHQVIGDPVVHVERMVQWDVDELVVMDISAGKETQFAHHRDDYRNKAATDHLSFIRLIANDCRIPLTFGGRARTLDDLRSRIQNGADKVTINTAALDDPGIIEVAARAFGSQAIVVCIDYSHGWVRRDHGSVDTCRKVVDWAKEVVRLGAGEILLHAVDRDGRACGYDLETISAVAEDVDVPVVACGGAGHMRHFLEALERTKVSAVAAGNIFHFTENAYPRAKTYLRAKREDVR